MKGIKRCLIIVIFIISLFFINTNINAYTINTHKDINFNEEYIYNRFSSDATFDINTHSNIFCYSSDLLNIYCYAYHKDEIFNNKNNYINSSKEFSCYRIYDVLYRPTSNTSNFYESCHVSVSYSSSYSYFSNFNIDFFTDDQNSKMNVLDFSNYMSNSSEEEKEKLEITNNATNLLNIMLDKTKNIYEVLINNQIFLFCLGILLSYLAFMVIYKIIKK